MKNQLGIIPLVVVVAVGVVGASGVTVAASQSSIPGDVLYPVKQATENVRLASAFSKKDKAKVHVAIAEEKVREIEKLEEKGETDKIAETAQRLEDSQDEALELTQIIKSEGENTDELEELLEVQSGRQQVVITRISPKISVQAGESLRKSLEQFREELKVTIESDEEEEKEEIEEEEDTEQEKATSTPCPSPSSTEDENNYSEYEDTSNEENEEEEWKKYQYYEDEDVQGVSALRNSQGSSYDSGAGSQTFDGGAGSGDFEDSTPSESPNDPCDSVESSNDQGSSNEEPTSASPEVEGVSTTGGLLQLILNALFQPQKR